jgi:hypothetical protein
LRCRAARLEKSGQKWAKTDSAGPFFAPVSQTPRPHADGVHGCHDRHGAWGRHMGLASASRQAPAKNATKCYTKIGVSHDFCRSLKSTHNDCRSLMNPSCANMLCESEGCRRRGSRTRRISTSKWWRVRHARTMASPNGPRRDHIRRELLDRALPVPPRWPSVYGFARALSFRSRSYAAPPVPTLSVCLSIGRTITW